MILRSALVSIRDFLLVQIKRYKNRALLFRAALFLFSILLFEMQQSEACGLPPVNP
jgi:hypothetical protein